MTLQHQSELPHAWHGPLCYCIIAFTRPSLAYKSLTSDHPFYPHVVICRVVQGKKRQQILWNVVALSYCVILPGVSSPFPLMCSIMIPPINPGISIIPLLAALINKKKIIKKKKFPVDDVLIHGLIKPSRKGKKGTVCASLHSVDISTPSFCCPIFALVSSWSLCVFPIHHFLLYPSIVSRIILCLDLFL